MTGFFYLANQAEIKASHLVQRNSAAAGAINGSAVDIANYDGPLLVMVNAPLASAGDTITFTVEHSEASGSGFGAVTASELVDPDSGDAATFTVVTDAVAVFQTLALKRERLKRYIRIVATTAGAAVDVTFAAYLIAQKRVY